MIDHDNHSIWRHILSTSRQPTPETKHYIRDDVEVYARKLGYRFMEFNGIIYFLAPDGVYDTGLRSDDLIGK